MSEPTKIPSYCAQCRSRCGCNAIVDSGKLLRIEPLPSHPSGAKLCPKGRAAPELVYHPDRLTEPMRRTSPKGVAPTTWEPISWSQAYAEISKRMLDIRDEHGAEQVAFSVTTPSGTQISDSISWVERLIRAFGSPNIIYGTEICNWHKDVATKFTYGSDIGTPDFANTDCVLLWGNNPTNTWLARAVEIHKARKRGAKLIVVDPRRTKLAGLADCWLQVRPGTDQIAALGLANLLITNNGYDADFVRRWSNGPLLVRTDTGALLRDSDLTPNGDANVFVALSEHSDTLVRYSPGNGQWTASEEPTRIDSRCTVPGLDGDIECRSSFGLFADEAALYPPERVYALTGVPPEALANACDVLIRSASVAYYAWNGVGQSPTATQTDRAISILYAMTGSYGDRGGNVAGGAAPFADISGRDLIGPTQQAKALGLKERPLGPARTGWITARDAYKAVLEQTPYPIRMLFSFGGNLLASQPDTNRGIQALKKLEFHVHADYFLNATARYADIVLPVSTSWERDALRAGFDSSLEGLRRVQLRPAVIDPIGQAKSDTDIALELAQRLGLSEYFFGGDKDCGRNHLLAPAGLTIDDLLNEPEGITIDTHVPTRAYTQTDQAGDIVGFPTASKLIEIYSEQMLAHGYDPIPIIRLKDLPVGTAQFPLRLSCAKTLAFCHSQHRNIESLRRLMPDPIVDISSDVAIERDVTDGDWVDVTTSAGSFLARCKIDKALQPGTVFAQHGWWIDVAAPNSLQSDDAFAANMNQAIDTAKSDPISGSVAMRCTRCEVAKHRAA